MSQASEFMDNIDYSENDNVEICGLLDEADSLDNIISEEENCKWIFNDGSEVSLYRENFTWD